MSIFTYIKRHAVLASMVTIGAVIIMIIAGRMASSKGATDNTASNVKTVALVNATDFKEGYSTVSADGVVESVSQVDLKSQTSAPLASLNFSVGDRVSAGQVIAEFQNSDIRAQLEQAKASLALAKGQFSTDAVSVESARKSAIEKVRDAYIKGDEVVHGQLEQFLFNGTGSNPPLSSYMTDKKLEDTVRVLFIDADNSFDQWKTVTDSLSTKSSDSTINAAIKLSQDNLDIISRLLDNVSIALNDATKNAPQETMAKIAPWKTIVSTARGTITGTISGLTATAGSLETSLTTQGSSAEAQVSVAEAGVKNLQAQLSKTIIVSPISGIVASAPLRVGELASPGQLVATVVGGGGLQVKAYASGEDIARITKGLSATVAGRVSGTVINVAPSVSSLNKKVEVKIAILDPDKSGLVVGQNVQVSIKTEKSATGGALTDVPYLLPMQNLKIMPGEAYVLTVDENSAIKMNPVILGNVKGDFIEVKSGIDDSMKIVSPVYELNEGETVRVQ